MIAWNHLIKEMYAQKIRILLTIFAIAWGTFSIASMLAVGEGLRLSFAQSLDDSGAGLIIANPGQSSLSFRGKPSKQKVIVSINDLPQIQAALPNIAAITGTRSIQAEIKRNNILSTAYPVATFPALAQLEHIKVLPGGRFINPLDIQQKRHVAVISEQAAAELFADHTPSLNQPILIGDLPFTVIGVTQKKKGPIQLNQAAVFIPYSTYQALTGDQQLSQLHLIAKPTVSGAKIETELQQFYANKYGFDPTDKQLFYFLDIAEAQQKTNAFFMALQLFLGALGTVTLFIAGVGIANVMLISVKQSTRQIGIRMALGARPYHILVHYLVEALCVSCLGGFIGIVFTAGCVAILDALPSHSNLLAMLGNPRPILSPFVMLIVCLALGIISFLAGFFPALKASLIRPAEALQHE